MTVLYLSFIRHFFVFLIFFVDKIKEKFNENEHVAMEYNELQRKYDAILQMYGEKVEETEELQLDLLDVKEMYKGQIDELLKQQKERNNQAAADV